MRDPEAAARHAQRRWRHCTSFHVVNAVNQHGYGCSARILLYAGSARYSSSFWRDLPLVPLRDTLLALQWSSAAFGSHVVWRGCR
jgi:ceramide glucosyltransferase